jgi:hypothetical protein
MHAMPVDPYHMKMKISGRFFPLLLMCFGLLVVPARAEDSTACSDGRLTLSGFGTLGLARSDNDSAEFVRDLSQPRGLTRQWSGKVDSVLGLQANWTLGAHTEAVIQAITRYRYDGSHDPEISWAFLRHDFSPDFQMRVGRLGTEFYMLADSRLIGYSNTAVRPPPDFYGSLIFSYFDGIDTSVGMNIGDGLLRAKLFYGHSPETSPFYKDITWDLDRARLLGGHLDYFQGPWQFRLAHAEVRFSSRDQPLTELANRVIDADPALALLKVAYTNPLSNRIELTGLVPELSTSNKTSRFDSIGIVYDKGPLRVQTMLGRIRHETESYEDNRAAFVIGSYRIGKLTPYLGYSTTKSKASTISTQLPGLSDFARGLSATTHADQHTITLGTRWDFHQNWAMKVQLDRIRGRAASEFLFRGSAVQWDGRMNVLSATLDFAF